MDDKVDMPLDDGEEKNESTKDTSTEDLEKALADEKKRSEDLFSQLQRVQADYDNYRKRMLSRMEEATKFASEKILLKILDVYDNLERALETDFAADPEAAKSGVEAIQKQIDKIFGQEGVRQIESLGTQFDPYYQHSVGTVNKSETPDKEVVEVYQKGYMLHEKVLRPALVCVNRYEVISNNDDEETSDETSENGDE